LTISSTLGESSATTRIWLLQGKLAGDNGQVLALGEFLAATHGWTIDLKPIAPALRQAGKQVFPRRPAARVFASGGMAAPWPDLVIACGSTPCVIAQWIKRLSGGRALHVQLGRLGARPEDIDLILETAQYGIAAMPNLMPLTLPFVRRDPARREAALAAWQPELAKLPRPWLGVLVGGPASPIRFGAEEASRLRRRIGELQRSLGGSVLVGYGPRTPITVQGILEAGRPESGLSESGGAHRFFGWPPPSPNPYPALLALADRFLVTCDSASMIADACVTDKPVELFMLPIPDSLSRLSSRGCGLSIDARRRRRARAGRTPDGLDRLRDLLVRKRLMTPYRDMRDLLHVLGEAGIVGNLNGASRGRGTETQQREFSEVGARIATLLRARPNFERGKT
jgi:mitochondrial fission protein ELM1